MVTALLRRINNDSFDLLCEILQQSLPDNSSEWITNLLVTEQEISLNYFRKFHSVELLYDFVIEKEVPELRTKTHKANCFISKVNNKVLIYGNNNACFDLINYLEENYGVRFQLMQMKIKNILERLDTIQFKVKKIEYCNVGFLNTSLQTFSLEFKTNSDAYSILKQINSNPSKIYIEIVFKKNICILKIDLINSSFNLKFNSLRSIDIDSLEELIMSFFEGE